METIKMIACLMTIPICLVLGSIADTLRDINKTIKENKKNK